MGWYDLWASMKCVERVWQRKCCAICILKNQCELKLIVFCFVTVGHAGAIIAAGRGTAEHKVIKRKIELGHVLCFGCFGAPWV